MTRSYGIDLGTTNSVISRLEDGKPIPIAINGSPIVPSVVLFDDDGRVAVGREARNLELLNPGHTIRSVKRRMGTDFTYEIGSRKLSPPEVSAEILRALVKGAEAATGEPVRDLVITVPAYFNDAQRKATLEAGEIAGLNVLRLLNEPTSASLVYGLEPGPEGADEPEIVLVYDLGGGTFDVSVLEVFGSVREVRATAGNSHLGGDDFDDLLLNHFLEELKKRHHVDPRDDARAMARLRRLAEDTKIRLSQEVEVHVHEEFLTQAGGQSIHFDLTVSRRVFETLIESLLESTMELARKAVEDAHLGDQQLSRVLLVGGSTRIPIVRDLLEKTFVAPVHEEIDPDLAVGLGAAVQAALLVGEPVDRLLVDVSAHSLGMLVFSEEDEYRDRPDTFAAVLRRNTALPAERMKEFYTMVDNQKHLEVEVFQGESPAASENLRVGAFGFDLKPVPAQSPVRVAFAYDLNGVVKISISQPGLENEKTVAMSVADTSKASRSADAVSVPASAVERKARELLGHLHGGQQMVLQALLARYLSTSGAAKEAAEEDLLDFFLQHAEDEGSEEDDGFAE